MKNNNDGNGKKRTEKTTKRKFSLSPYCSHICKFIHLDSLWRINDDDDVHGRIVSTQYWLTVWLLNEQKKRIVSAQLNIVRLRISSWFVTICVVWSIKNKQNIIPICAQQVALVVNNSCFQSIDGAHEPICSGDNLNQNISHFLWQNQDVKCPTTTTTFDPVRRLRHVST